MMYFLTVLSIGLCIIFCFLYARDHTRLKLKEKIGDRLDTGDGIDHVVIVMSEHLPNFGVSVLGFYRKNRLTMHLESEKGSIPMLEASGAVKALFNQVPQYSDSRYEVDRKICESLAEKRIVFIPLRMKGTNRCWQVHNCQDRQCKHHSSTQVSCWTNSEKHFRGQILETYAEKTKKCLQCQVFLPVGVLAVKDTSLWSLSKAHAFIEKNFPGPLKKAVHFERALYTSTTDHLTGIPNRRSLMISLKSLLDLAGRYKQPMSFAMLDIDFFKKFNDTYGHRTGDFVLRGLAQLLESSVRESDVVARYGGEEFSIIFPNTDKQSARSVCEKLRKEIENEVFIYNRQELKLTVSMGVASFPEDAVEMAPLIEKADAALRHSKNTNRNKVTIYTVGMESAGKGAKKESEKTERIPKRTLRQTENAGKTVKIHNGGQTPPGEKSPFVVGTE
jgi:diguanylate cyclase (GGDEF)-like protein